MQRTQYLSVVSITKARTKALGSKVLTLHLSLAYNYTPSHTLHLFTFPLSPSIIPYLPYSSTNNTQNFTQHNLSVIVYRCHFGNWRSCLSPQHSSAHKYI